MLLPARGHCNIKCGPYAPSHIISPAALTGGPLQLVRLPSVRGRIAAWRAQHSLPQLPALDPPPDVVQAAGQGQEEGEGQGERPSLASLLADLRSGDVYKRGVAAGRINNMLIEWGRQPHRAERAQVMEVGGGLASGRLAVGVAWQPWAVGSCSCVSCA